MFFAVTIPQENMERYFPNLQMEGMAYRLTDDAGPDEHAARRCPRRSWRTCWASTAWMP